MGFRENFEEYKQRKEARDYFNQNNDEKVLGKDYLIAIVVGLISSMVMGMLLTWLISKIGVNFSYFTIVIGVLESFIIKWVLHKSGQQLAIIAAITFMVGVILGQAIYMTMTIPFAGISIFIELFKYCFKYMITGDVLNTIIYILGAMAAYMSLKD